MKPLVFLHGWGQSARIWQAQQPLFASRGPVLMPNLPGHGGTSDVPAPDWVVRLAAGLPRQPAMIVGWSLGGMLAIRIALASPERVAALVLVGTTPRFRRARDWKAGCPADIFHRFEQDVRGDPARAVRRFVSLMLHGDDLPHARRRAIMAAANPDEPPSVDALRHGLDLLDRMDLRAQLARLRLPCLVMHGTRDAVTPFAAGAFLAANIAGAELVSFDAGHAPFLTRADAFNHRLEAWCRKII